MRRTHDHHVANNQRCGIESDLRRVEIEILVGIELEVDGAAGPERRDRITRSGVERHHAVPRRDIDDAAIVAARPVRKAPAGSVPGRVLASHALVLSMHPSHLATDGVERDDGSSHARGRVQGAIDDQRGGRIEGVGPRSEEIGLEPPGDTESIEVVFRDLVCR